MKIKPYEIRIADLELRFGNVIQIVISSYEFA